MLGSNREIKELCEKILSLVEKQESKLESVENQVNVLKIEHDTFDKQNSEKMT